MLGWLLKEQQSCCRKDWHSRIGALLSRPTQTARYLTSLSRGFRQCGNTAACSAKRRYRECYSDRWRQRRTPIHKFNPADRRHFIGGSDARIIMGDDEADLVRLWREKRGEIEPEDLSGNLIVQLGTVTEELNRAWYQRNSGQTVTDVQRRVRHPVHKWMAATLDGIVEQTGAVFEAKFMLPWAFTEEAAAEKHMAQLQHNMWVVAARSAVLSIITGGGKWVEIKIHADPLYQHLLLTAEKKFWRCVQSGEPPRLFGVEPPRPRLEAVRVVDMSFVQPLGRVCGDLSAHQCGARRARARKGRAEEARTGGRQGGSGHGIRARRSKSGAISFDLFQAETVRCTDPVNTSARSRRRSPGPRPSYQPGKDPDCHHPLAVPTGGRPHVPLCFARKWPRHRPQDAEPAGDRHRPDHPDRAARDRSTSPPCLRMPPANGSPPTGRSVPARIPRRRTGWERR